jgi:predicted phosphodiesterase
MVLSALWEDLKNRDKIDSMISRIDAVFFTGDLVYHGFRSEYQLVDGEFLSPLLDSLYIGSKQLFLVPGNHDIDKTKVGQAARSLNADVKTQDEITALLENESDRDVVGRKMGDYLQFFGSVFSEKEINPLGWFYVGEIMIDNKRVAVLGLNTAWLCTGEQTDQPCLGERQVVEAIKGSGASSLTVALFHHPIGKLRESDDTDLCEAHLRDSCDIWLHGHVHKQSVQSLVVPQGSYISIPSGSVFDTRKSPNAYSVGVVDLDTGKGKVCLRKFDGTQWIPDVSTRHDKGAVPIALDLKQRQGAPPVSVTVSCRPATTSALPSNMNPFTFVAAESMGAEDIRRLFVGRHTKLDIATKRFGTIIEGQRGTGKSMILRYLSFPVQIRDWMAKQSDAANYFNEKGYIGVYCKLPQGVFDKQDLTAIPDFIVRTHVFEHKLAAYFCIAAIGTIVEILEYMSMAPKDYQRFAAQLKRIFRDLEKSTAAWTQNDPLDLLTACRDLLRDEARSVDEFLRERSDTPFRSYLTLTGSLCDFLDLFRECAGLRTVSFFLLVDDFDVLHDWQQQILFSAAAQRRFDLVCFKFASMSEGKKTDISSDGHTFRPGDDYDPIVLDWIEKGLLNTDYPDAVALIAAKRLKEAGWDTLLGKNLPEVEQNGTKVNDVIVRTNSLLEHLFMRWEHGQKLRVDIKKEMNQEWQKAEKKPTKKPGDYVSKYGNARYFQELRKKGLGERYAGYGYLTVISSGIIRQFLEIGSEILGLAYKNGWSIEEGRGISAEIQDQAIRQYSESFFQNLNKGAGAYSKQDLGDQVSSQQVADLIEALSELFFERLHSPKHGEPELLAFALKDVTPYIEALLRVCVRESVLQKFSYPPKTAGGPRYPAYVLNRRLVPRRSLSALRMQGRVELTAQDIMLALRNRKAFVKKFLPKADRRGQLDLVQGGEVR